MYVSLVKLALIAGFCSSVRAVFKFRTSTCTFRNKIIKANSLWKQDGILDKLTCAVVCMMDSQCLTFSYSRSEGICRGYSSNVDHYRDMLEDFERNTVFGVKRPHVRPGSCGSRCRGNDGCSFRDSVCYAGVCLCRPGLYYSPQRNICLRECDEFGDGMDRYRGASIKGHNENILFNTTLTSCCDLCIREKEFTCLTVDWDRRYGECYLSRSGYLDVSSYYREHGFEDWMFAQRRCK